MDLKLGDEVWFIFKENYDKEKSENYKLIAKSGIIGSKLPTGEYEIGYLKDDKPVVIARHSNNIFDSKEKCEKAITKLYQGRIYNFLKQAIDIFERYL